MQCLKCQHGNRLGAKFCDECGARLVETVRSPSTVGIARTDETKGLRRSIPQDLVEALQAQGGRIEGERRLVTVLFADIAEFTPMCERLDSEQVTNIVNRCFRARRICRTCQPFDTVVLGQTAQNSSTFSG